MRNMLKILILLLLCSLTACSDNNHKGEYENKDNIDIELMTGEKDGETHFGYFIQEDCVSDIDERKYRLSTYEELELAYVCMNPVCTHSEDSECTALTVKHETDEDIALGFCATYNNKLIIVDSYRLKLSDTEYEWKTDIYEADLDGSNRKCMLSFDGSVDNSAFMNDTIMVDGKLYFGGGVSENYKTSTDNEGIVAFNEEYKSAIFSVDLNSYTVTELVKMDRKLGMCNMYEFDGWVYITERKEPNINLYRINNGTGECELICEFNEIVIISGVIDNTIYYQYQNRDMKTIYKREIGSSEEILFVDNSFHSVVMDKKIYVMEDGWTENATKYSVYDESGAVLENFEYGGYMYLCGDVGDKVIYYTQSAVGVVNKIDLKDIMTNGQELGSPM